MKYKVIVFLLMCFVPSILQASEVNCGQTEKVLQSKKAKSINVCIWKSLHALQNSSDFEKESIVNIIKLLLPVNKEEYDQIPFSSRFFIEYEHLAILISKLDSDEIYEKFLDYLVVHDVDEMQMRLFGKMYILEAPKLIEMTSRRPKKEIEKIISEFAYGISSMNYWDMNFDNYKRKSVGTHWELLDDKYIHRDIAFKVENKIKTILLHNQKHIEEKKSKSDNQ